MFPPRLDYLRPESLEEVLELLARYGGEGRLLAGGQSIIPLMKLRLLSPVALIDINRVSELEAIKEDSLHGFRIGALSRHHHMEIRRWPPSLSLLKDAARVIGDPQVRNLGTVGGSLAQADPAGDWGPVMLCLGAKIRILSCKQERSIPADELFQDAYTTCLGEDELLREVEIPPLREGTGTAYLKMERKSGDFAIASAAVRLCLGPDRRCEEVGIGLGGVGLVPLRPRRAEGSLRDSFLNDQAIAETEELVRQECDPIADLRGSSEFKRHVAGVLFRRALKAAMLRAQGEKVEAPHV